MALQALLTALPYIAQIGSAVLPFVSQMMTNQTGSGTSSTASSQQSITQGSMNQSGSSTTTSVQQGSPSGVANVLGQSIGTPTGSNWQQAFQASQGSATTANNLQTGAWAMNNTLNAFSNLMANVGNLWSQTSAKKYNSEEAKLSREWQEYMRGSAYQATVKDLKAAGLNPILAASRGATDTPGGTYASTSPGNFSQMVASAFPSAHTASAQAMYDYGNNMAQYVNNAISAISNAKSIGMNQTVSQLMQSTMQIVDSSAKQIQESTSQMDSAMSRDWGKGGNQAPYNSTPEGQRQAVIDHMATLADRFSDY